MPERGLSVNDVFYSREDAEEAMASCAAENGLSYDVERTPRAVALSCRGRGEFGCEAKIAAILRKKDGVFVVKRMKLVHKCPAVTHQYSSSNEMVRVEIQKAIGDAHVRVGEVVSILANMNIRVGYLSVWKAMRDEEKENEGGSRREMDGVLAEFSQELVDLNPGAVACHRSQMLFFAFPEHLRVLVPIVEVKAYKKTDGWVVFGVLHGPASAPVVHSCVIAEGCDREAALEYFVECIPDVFFLVGLDAELIRILEGRREFFVKTRDVCKFYYGRTRSTDVVEQVWNRCNNDWEYDMSELGLEKKRYVKKYCETALLGLHNTGECDVDFISLAVFGFPFLDCANAILKLTSDNLRLRKRIGTGDRQSLFGHNVVHRIEKNLLAPSGSEQTVDLDAQTCTCGRFQELLIPCPHACRAIADRGEDPYMYVGGMYSKTRLLELRDVVPVVSLPVKCQSDRHLLKRGPGRPKKNFRESEGIH